MATVIEQLKQLHASQENSWPRPMKKSQISKMFSSESPNNSDSEALKKQRGGKFVMQSAYKTLAIKDKTTTPAAAKDIFKNQLGETLKRNYGAMQQAAIERNEKGTGMPIYHNKNESTTEVGINNRASTDFQKSTNLSQSPNSTPTFSASTSPPAPPPPPPPPPPLPPSLPTQSNSSIPPIILRETPTASRKISGTTQQKVDSRNSRLDMEKSKAMLENTLGMRSMQPTWIHRRTSANQQANIDSSEKALNSQASPAITPRTDDTEVGFSRSRPSSMISTKTYLSQLSGVDGSYDVNKDEDSSSSSSENELEKDSQRNSQITNYEVQKNEKATDFSNSTSLGSRTSLNNKRMSVDGGNHSGISRKSSTQSRQSGSIGDFEGIYSSNASFPSRNNSVKSIEHQKSDVALSRRSSTNSATLAQRNTVISKDSQSDLSRSSQMSAKHELSLRDSFQDQNSAISKTASNSIPTDYRKTTGDLDNKNRNSKSKRSSIDSTSRKSLQREIEITSPVRNSVISNARTSASLSISSDFDAVEGGKARKRTSLSSEQGGDRHSHMSTSSFSAKPVTDTIDRRASETTSNTRNSVASSVEGFVSQGRTNSKHLGQSSDSDSSTIKGDQSRRNSRQSQASSRISMDPMPGHENMSSSRSNSFQYVSDSFSTRSNLERKASQSSSLADDRSSRQSSTSPIRSMSPRQPIVISRTMSPRPFPDKPASSTLQKILSTSSSTEIKTYKSEKQHNPVPSSVYHPIISAKAEVSSLAERTKSNSGSHRSSSSYLPNSLSSLEEHKGPSNFSSTNSIDRMMRDRDSQLRQSKYEEIANPLFSSTSSIERIEDASRRTSRISEKDEINSSSTSLSKSRVSQRLDDYRPSNLNLSKVQRSESGRRFESKTSELQPNFPNSTLKKKLIRKLTEDDINFRTEAVKLLEQYKSAPTTPTHTLERPKEKLPSPREHVRRSSSVNDLDALKKAIEAERLIEKGRVKDLVKGKFLNLKLTGGLSNPELFKKKESEDGPRIRKKWLVEGIDIPATSDEALAPYLPSRPINPFNFNGEIPEPPPPPPPLDTEIMSGSSSSLNRTKKQGFSYIKDRLIHDQIVKKAEEVSGMRVHEKLERRNSQKKEHDESQNTKILYSRENLVKRPPLISETEEESAQSSSEVETTKRKNPTVTKVVPRAPIQKGRSNSKSEPFSTNLEEKIDFYHYDAKKNASKDTVLKKRFNEQSYRSNSTETSDNSPASSEEKEDEREEVMENHHITMNMGDSTIFSGRVPQRYFAPDNQYETEYFEPEPYQVVVDPYQDQGFEYQIQDGYDYVEAPEYWITDPPEKIQDNEGFQYDFPRKPEVFSEQNIARVEVSGEKNNYNSKYAHNPSVITEPYAIINSEKSAYLPENYENQVLLEDDLELAALEEARDSAMNPILFNDYSSGVQQTYILQPIGEISSVINPTAISEISAPSLTTQLKIQTGSMIAMEENGQYKVEVPFGLYTEDTSVIDPMQQAMQPVQLQQFHPIFLDEQFQQQYYNPNIMYVTSLDDVDFGGQMQYQNQNQNAPHSFTGTKPNYEMQINQQIRVDYDQDNLVRGSILIEKHLDENSPKRPLSDDHSNPFHCGFRQTKENPMYSSDPDLRMPGVHNESEEAVRATKNVPKTSSLNRDTKIFIDGRQTTADQIDSLDYASSSEYSEHDLTDYPHLDSLPKGTPINPSEEERRDILRLLANAPADSIRQSINVEREEEEIIGPSEKGADPLLNYDTVSEKVDLCLKDGVAELQVKVRCERVVPIKGSDDMFKKSSVIVTRQIDVDLEATAERRRLLKKIQRASHTDQKGRVRLSTKDTFRLYRTFMGMAEQEEGFRNRKIAVEEEVDERTRPSDLDNDLDFDLSDSDFDYRRSHFPKKSKVAEDDAISFQSAVSESHVKRDLLY